MFEGPIGQWLASSVPRWLLLAFVVGSGITLLIWPRDIANVATAATDVAVSDRAGVLSSDAERAMTAQLDRLELEKGPEVTVVTVESLQGNTIERFARDLANSMSLGDPQRHDGVLVLVAPEDRQVRIEVGSGLERVLSNDIAAGIIRDRMLPYFRRGDIEGGTQSGVDAVARTLSTFPTKVQP